MDGQRYLGQDEGYSDGARTMKYDWIIAVDKGWFLWHYVLFLDSNACAYGFGLTERGAWANAKNRRDRIVRRVANERMKIEKRRQEILRKTVI